MGDAQTAPSRWGQYGPYNSGLTGHVYRITDPTAFFLPILFGGTQDPQSYEPWAGLEVRTWSVNELFPIPFPGGSAQTGSDGSFDITQTPPYPIAGGGDGADQASDIRFGLLVSEGAFPYRPLYRSDLSLTVAAAETTELNIWLLTETIDPKDGITAADVSTTLHGSGLPGNTNITASPSGLAFTGSDSGADVTFGISITPDTSFDLTTFLDLQLSSWNIHVGWPADWCTSADDILVEIVQGLQGAGASMNASVLKKIEAFFAAEESLPAATATTFFDTDVAVTFMDITYPTTHTWPLSSTTDSTVVIAGDLCIGYPRHLSSDPSKLPVFEPVRLSRALRPVRV
jgi:hypothetical protein